MNTEITTAITLVVLGVIGITFVIVKGTQDAKKNRKNGPFKDRA